MANNYDEKLISRNSTEISIDMVSSMLENMLKETATGICVGTRENVMELTGSDKQKAHFDNIELSVASGTREGKNIRRAMGVETDNTELSIKVEPTIENVSLDVTVGDSANMYDCNIQETELMGQMEDRGKSLEIDYILRNVLLEHSYSTFDVSSNK